MSRKVRESGPSSSLPLLPRHPTRGPRRDSVVRTDLVSKEKLEEKTGPGWMSGTVEVCKRKVSMGRGWRGQRVVGESFERDRDRP